jgi:hypothetical protein
MRTRHPVSERIEGTNPSRGFWITSALALVWNLIGVATYLMTVTMSDETLAALPEAERALQANIPAWVTSAYAIAVFGGTLGCIALLMRVAWAVPVLLVSLLAILVQMGHALFGTPMIAVMGPSAAVLPLLIVVIAVYLVAFAAAAKKKTWIGSPRAPERVSERANQA